MESTQLRDRKILGTKLERVIERSKQDRGAEFNNLGHIIDINLLRQCYRSLDGRKAVGIDKVTKEEYGKKLNENLQDLLLKIRRGSYHPQPSRIVEIPKADGSLRPLAIACTEDKIVQEAVRRVIESIYEPLFTSDSHGFRPGRGCETALVALNESIMKYGCGGVLEIDLKQYFNTIPHEPLERTNPERGMITSADRFCGPGKAVCGRTYKIRYIRTVSTTFELKANNLCQIQYE